MLRSPLRFAPACLLAASLSACSGGGANVAPSPHQASAAGKTTKASFTIQWTNPSAPTSVRHRDTISPSAQSIVVLINGAPGALANRNGSSTQTIPLIAPVGNDQFIFNVYDGPNGQGHLLGAATVQQLIVDGAANSLTAVIQAVCATTNVQYAGDDLLSHVVSAGPGGVYAASVQSAVLAGQSSATFVIGPEDADGNVIIAGSGGQVAYSITGSASVQPIDGAHISLTPLTGARTTTPDTLTVAAPTCPTTTVAVQHSPAIFVESTSGAVFALDWYGDLLFSTRLSLGDTLIGYDVVNHKLITYNPSNGNVYSYPIALVTPSLLYTTISGALVKWSNYLHAVFGVYFAAGDSFYFTHTGGEDSVFYGVGGTAVAIATSTSSYSSNAFSTTGSTIYSFSLATLSETHSVAAPYTVDSLATDDGFTELYAFDSTASYVSVFTQSLAPVSTGNFGFASFPVVGGADTDGHNIYAVLTSTAFAGSTSAGTALTGGDFGNGVGTGLAIVVISTNSN